jgi:uncharacterized membrane protein
VRSGVGLNSGIVADVGALVGHFIDYGIDDEFIKSLSAGMGPSTSALVVLISDVNREGVIPEISKYGGTVLRRRQGIRRRGRCRTSKGQASSADDARAGRRASASPNVIEVE